MVVTTGIFFVVPLLFPNAAGAFWPFEKIQAQTDGASSTFLHDSRLSLLEPAQNFDPRPSTAGEVLALSGDQALLPGGGPEAIPVDTQKTGSSGKIEVYVVKDGDSLSAIAAKHNVTTNTILWANNIKDPKLVKTGTELVILPVSGVRHTVAKGDTIAGLGKKYGAKIEDIIAFNGIVQGALTAGETIVVPGGQLPKAKTQTAVKAVKSGGGLSTIQATTSTGTATSGYFENPVPGSIVTQKIHGWNGVDLGASSGTPVYAAAAGTVIVSRGSGWNGGYGNYVVIKHGNGTQTLYSHLSAVTASVGDTVAKGQRIGAVGKTGSATGFHLHFEVRGATNPFSRCTLLKACVPN